MSWLAVTRTFVLAATAYVATAYALRLVMILIAWRQSGAQRRFRESNVPEAAIASSEMPSVSVVVPAFNEEASIRRTVESLLAQSYTSFEVIVVSDGSTDRTLGALLETFQCAPAELPSSSDIATQAVRSVFRSRTDSRLKVIDKRNGGKADALNVGINHSTGQLVCVVDADVILDRWALYYLALPFAEDAATVASSGVIRLHNGCVMTRTGAAEIRLPRRWVERFQVLEYTVAFGMGRLFFNVWSSHVVISGAFGLFSRDILNAISGFQPNAIGEDMELVVRMHRYLRDAHRPYRIAFVSDAICYTEAPSSWGELGRQRTRWHQGLLTTLRLHRAMIGRARYGAAGLFSLPYFLFFELLAPVVEAVGWLMIVVGVPFRLVDLHSAGLFLLTSMVLGTTAAWVAVFLDDLHAEYYPRFRQLLQLGAYAVIDHFGYHQLMLYYRLRAFWRFYGSVHLKGGWVSPVRQAATDSAGEPPPGAAD
jgi:cellulose synthase/poly-beta-1,6-N-acetylglucosamine synthase-like glycosyltransferase